MENSDIKKILKEEMDGYFDGIIDNILEGTPIRKKYSYDYPMPLITVDVIVECDDEVLLIKRKNEPYKDCWAMPGGYLEMNETIEDGAYRELEEETGLSKENGISNLKFLNYLDEVNRDPRGRTVSMVFSGYCKNKDLVKAGDDAKEFKWFKVNELPEMAFDHKKQLLRYYNK